MDIRQTFRVLSRKLKRWLELPIRRQITEDPLQPFWNHMLGPIQDKRNWLQRWVQSPEYPTKSNKATASDGQHEGMSPGTASFQLPIKEKSGRQNDVTIH